MKCKCELNNSNGWIWQYSEGVWLKGYIIGEDERDLMTNLRNMSNTEEIVKKIASLRGHFACVVKTDSTTIAAVDNVRSIPLFFECTNDSIIIKDFLTEKELKNRGLDDNIIKIFERSLYSPGDTTLLKGIKQIEAGNVLIVGKDDFKIYEYKKYNYSQELITDESLATSKLYETYDEAFSNIAKKIGDKDVLIPLSGGHDSRLVAFMLKKHGCKRIITFSYGESSNEESNIAKNVADQLGIEFYFVEYGRKAKDQFRTIEKDFLLYAANYSSVPCIQDIIAVKSLLDSGKLKKDSIVVPGLGGVLTGHYIKESYLRSETVESDELLRFIKECYFGKKVSDRIIENTIDNYITKLSGIREQQEISGKEALEMFERYTFKEEQSKFIANAVRGYEYLGLKWMIPLFEQKIFEVWSKIDNSLRFGDLAFKKMEEVMYPAEIKNIKFTGSKEIKHFYNDSKVESVMKKRIQRYFFPRKTHYLNKFIPLSTYYYNLIVKRNCGINASVCRRYLQILDRIYKN